MPQTKRPRKAVTTSDPRPSGSTQSLCCSSSVRWSIASVRSCGVGASLIGDGSSADPGVPRLLRSERNGRRSQELPPPQEFIVDGGASLAEGFCARARGVSACAPATVSPPFARSQQSASHRAILANRSAANSRTALRTPQAEGSAVDFWTCSAKDARLFQKGINKFSERKRKTGKEKTCWI